MPAMARWPGGLMAWWPGGLTSSYKEGAGHQQVLQPDHPAQRPPGCRPIGGGLEGARVVGEIGVEQQHAFGIDLRRHRAGRAIEAERLPAGLAVPSLALLVAVAEGHEHIDGEAAAADSPCDHRRAIQLIERLLLVGKALARRSLG